MNKFVLLFSPIFLSIVLCSCSVTKPINNQQIVAVKKDTAQATIQQPSLIDDAILNNAHVGICIYEPATNTYLYNYQSNKYFIPASNTKIATCYAAMKYLGDSLVGGFFSPSQEGLTYFVPSGDPTFLHKDFPNQNLFNKLKQFLNIGIVNFSMNKFSALGSGWSWNDYEEPYMAERSIMPVYGNLLNVNLENNRLKIIPENLKKQIKIDSSNNNSSLPTKHRHIGVNDIAINKKELLKNPLSLTYTTSFNTLLDVLEDTLHNISKINSGVKRENDFGYQLNKIYSQPTDSLLKPMMHNSDNFFAEQTLLMVSLNQLGFMSDEKIIDTLLKTDFKNLPQKPKWVDGSGLSRYNLFSPQDFVFILNKMKNEFSWQRISTIFPTGDEGTLKGYYKKYQNKIFAKTGTISNNLSLSGFIKTNSGKDYIFSIIINNHQSSTTDIRLAIEKFIASIIENK